MDGAFRGHVVLQLILKNPDGLGGWIKSQMILIGRKIYEYPVLLKSRHAVTDHFGCRRSGLADRFPNLPKHGSDILVVGIDVFVDGFWLAARYLFQFV